MHVMMMRKYEAQEGVRHGAGRKYTSCCSFCNVDVVVSGKVKKKDLSSALVTVELLYYKLCNASHARPALVPT